MLVLLCIGSEWRVTTWRNREGSGRMRIDWLVGLMRRKQKERKRETVSNKITGEYADDTQQMRKGCAIQKTIVFIMYTLYWYLSRHSCAESSKKFVAHAQFVPSTMNTYSGSFCPWSLNCRYRIRFTRCSFVIPLRSWHRWMTVRFFLLQ